MDSVLVVLSADNPGSKVEWSISRHARGSGHYLQGKLQLSPLYDQARVGMMEEQWAL